MHALTHSNRIIVSIVYYANALLVQQLEILTTHTDWSQALVILSQKSRLFYEYARCQQHAEWWESFDVLVSVLMEYLRRCTHFDCWLLLYY